MKKDVNTLKTGDILLFSGTGVISTLIQAGTFSKWSHVGMVVEFEGKLCVWESTTLSNVPDVNTGIKMSGVQLVDLNARLNSYNGEVSARKLKHNIFPCLSDSQLSALDSFRDEIRGRKYEEDNIELAKSAYDGPFGQNEEDLSSIFCSEQVAEALQCMCVLDQSIPSNEFTPANFGEEEGLPMINGWYFGEEQEVIA